MKTIRTPDRCAWAMIPAAVPPLERLTYQIHMPVPSSAVCAVFSGFGGFRMRIGPTAFDRRPRFATTRMRPVRAESGTVTT
jgi:hypothetical protein